MKNTLVKLTLSAAVIPALIFAATPAFAGPGKGRGKAMDPRATEQGAANV
jgi:hypothetical protein